MKYRNKDHDHYVKYINDQTNKSWTGKVSQDHVLIKWQRNADEMGIWIEVLRKDDKAGPWRPASWGIKANKVKHIITGNEIVTYFFTAKDIMREVMDRFPSGLKVTTLGTSYGFSLSHEECEKIAFAQIEADAFEQLKAVTKSRYDNAYFANVERYLYKYMSLV